MLTILNSSSPSVLLSITHLQNALQQVSSWMTANVLTLNSSKTEFLLIGLKQQLAQISSCSLDTAHFARNLGFIFDEHISFSDQISALSQSCYSHIGQLCSIRPYLDHKTASTIATFIVHFNLDYCDSLYYHLPNTQLNRLQHIHNSLSHVLSSGPQSPPISTLLSNLYTGLKLYTSVGCYVLFVIIALVHLSLIPFH